MNDRAFADMPQSLKLLLLMTQPLRAYASFRGRAGREEFWLFTLFMTAGTAFAAWLDWFVLGVRPADGPDLYGIVFIAATILPCIAVSTRRLHDVNRSGWWQLLIFLPVIGWLVLLAWSLRRGDAGTNRFGRDPRAERIIS